MTAYAPADADEPFLLVDNYHGWHRLPDDPPGGFRGPTAPQKRVLQLLRDAPPKSTTIILYGGAAGGGKSNLLANGAYEVALEAPGSSNLVTRQAYVHLKPTTQLEFDECLDPRYEVHRYDSSPVFRNVRRNWWDAWSTVWFRPMDDWQTLMSTAYSTLWIEEGQETTERSFLALLSRLRHNSVQKWAAVVGFNPFPSWPTDWAHYGKIPPLVAQEPNTRVVYVPSRIRDNAFLREGYESFLRAMYSNDPWMTAVLIEGRAEAVPNAVYGILNDPEVRNLMQSYELPPPALFARGATGWDWGTSEAHKSAGVLLGEDKHGLIWVLDAWESALGSGSELKRQAEHWQSLYFDVRTARYDKSQASLEDDLRAWYPDTEPGVRDVEGRIRDGRGVVYTNRLRFNWRSEGARLLYAYLLLYHRDDKDKIVEEKDDMVDAFHYALWALTHPGADIASFSSPEGQSAKWAFSDALVDPSRPATWAHHDSGLTSPSTVERVR